jgi:hypothetical protein
MDDESRFHSFRYELESGARYVQFVIALLASLTVLLALALLVWKH